jgi:crotonobetainyl-CoA:carnitine CoA-transferase CaiB-like acyl-CoA transferase
MFDLLEGIRALEVALLSPDSLGMHLADLGAEVIKVESPPAGDYVRSVGGLHLGGRSLLHLRWNRGKKSVLLDLKRDAGRALFLELAAKSHAVIDGLRAGTLDGYGVGYAQVRAVNPAIVYCALNGTGQSGPYAELATHGLAYDAYAGLAPPALREDGAPYIPASTPVGISAGSLYAALGVAAALVRAQRTGEGRMLEVAQMDCAAAWQANAIDAAMNRMEVHFESMKDAVRYQYYRCRDGKCVVFQASEAKFWERFCNGVGKPELIARSPNRQPSEHARGDEELRSILAGIFATRTRAEWVHFFIEHDVPGGPVNDAADLAADPHFMSRGLTFEQDHPRAGKWRSFGPPILVAGQRFSAGPAPEAGADTDAVLSSLLGLGAERLHALRAEKVI